MTHTIDQLENGQRIAVRYAKTPDAPKTYYGEVESIKGDLLTIKMRGNKFRSFKFSKIVTIVNN